ncbi:uncharacterized protein EDB91DRAFT_248784 [Suillus paluster]|uniref:uncharacterized protein n=1 Tax=Suillus paluster TaxID=48578 RepID=UPI001B86B596|nr:uncharacterized protein EDB91DRAFT_248784 [Suillus paluster]KAG1754715.1 hypothetical protein EDB91DRAFT_248784 [Suillus paluster]
MDEDVDMDAPQISTLREENTPPPSRTSKFRVKLLVTEKKGKGKSSSPSVPASNKKVAPQPPVPPPPPPAPQTRPQSDDDVEEEDEEDQLIDDEDELQQSAATPAVTVSTGGTKRKAPARKPKPRKSEKQDKDIDKKPHEQGEQPDAQDVSISAVADKPPPKKRAAPRRPAATQRSRAKAPPKYVYQNQDYFNHSMALRAVKTLAVPPLDDGALSESYAGTAPSSPLPLAREGGSEHEDMEHAPAPPPAEGIAEIAPLPVYPLPSKPFPVQPPPKIGTGFAPMLPLDRSGTKVRRWRTANREIRGIAGGRWFARSWVGDKESEFANATAATHKNGDADKIAMPKGGGSISAPLLGKGSSKSKASRAASGISAAPSRAGSIIPDHHPVKAPSKMRNIVAGPASEAEGNDPLVQNTPEKMES